MAQIQDPLTGGILAVELASKAARVLPVFGDGTPITKKKDGRYYARLDIVPTVITAGTAFFSMRNNSSTKNAELELVELLLSFIGTAALSRSIYELVRFSGANTTGGTAIAAVKSDNIADANAVVNDIRFAPAGLTVTGVVFEANPLLLVSHANQLTVAPESRASFGAKIVLNPGEGLAIRSNGALVAGSGVHGFISWNEVAV